MRFTTLQEWLDWQLELHYTAIDMGLERVRIVAERLGLGASDISSRPAKPVIITVGGTNGKGSCVRVLEQLLLGAGKSVGAFSSPHLLHYNERIRVNGREARDEQIMQAFAAIDQARGDLSLTYFEFGTLAAAWLFNHLRTDVWLLEVGLGGRLDAANLWDADAALITSIGLDHMEFLGDNREQIGAEKAGIFRPDQWSICADSDPPATVSAQADEVGARLLQLDRDFSFEADNQTLSIEIVGGVVKGGVIKAVELTLPEPSVVYSNAVAAVVALNCLDLLPSPAICAEVMAKVAVTGRFQEARYRGAELRIDVAHNPQAALALRQRVERIAPNYAGVIAVAAMMADKDVDGVVANLAPLVKHWLLPNLAGVDRAASNLDLAAVLAKHTTDVSLVEDLEQGLEAAASQYPGYLVLVFGSFFTAEACLRCLGADSR